MKQTVKKTDVEKIQPLEGAQETKVQKSSQAEAALLKKPKNTPLFSRFLEASCDCV